MKFQGRVLRGRDLWSGLGKVSKRSPRGEGDRRDSESSNIKIKAQRVQKSWGMGLLFRQRAHRATRRWPEDNCGEVGSGLKSQNVGFIQKSN